jgi:AraC family transcriptional regulator
MRCKSILRDRSQENPPDTSEAHQRDLPGAERRPADAEMVRVLKTAPVRIASDPSSGAASPIGNMAPCMTSSNPWLITSS